MWKQRRMVAAAAAVAALLVAGCGSGSAEPSEKQWEKDDSQSQSESSGKSQKDDGGKGQGSGSSDKDDSSGDSKDDKKKVIRKGDGDAAGPGKATVAQVESFFADYLAALNKATQDGDFSDVDPMVKECSVCKGSREYIESVYNGGGKIKGSLFVDPSIDVGGQHDGKVTVTVVSQMSAYTVTDASGTEVDSGPAAEETYQYTVAKKDGTWRITSGRFVK